jgi:hypothetical protein
LYLASRINRDTDTEPTESTFLFSLLPPEHLFGASQGSLTFYRRLDSQGIPVEDSKKTFKNPARYHLAIVHSLSQMIDSPLTDHNNQVITNCYSGHVQMHMNLNEAELANLTPLKRYLDSKSSSGQHRPGSAGRRRRRDQRPSPQEEEEKTREDMRRAEQRPGSAGRKLRDHQPTPQQEKEGNKGGKKKDDRLAKRKETAEPAQKKMRKTPSASASRSSSTDSSKSRLLRIYKTILAEHKTMMTRYKKVKGPKQDTLPPQYQSKSIQLHSYPISSFSLLFSRRLLLATSFYYLFYSRRLLASTSSRDDYSRRLFIATTFTRNDFSRRLYLATTSRYELSSHAKFIRSI